MLMSPCPLGLGLGLELGEDLDLSDLWICKGELIYMWMTGMTDNCGTECILHRTHAQYWISFSHDFSKKKVFFNRNGRALALQARGSEIESLCFQKKNFFFDSTRTWTWNLLIRSQAPYPFGHRVSIKEKQGIARFWSSYLRVMSPTQ